MQKKFVLKILMFCSLVLIVVLSMWLVITSTRKRICYQSDVNTIVLGNSRIQYGVDDSMLPGVMNCGLNADNYNLMYWKLKLMHKYNPQLETVWLLCDRYTVFSYIKSVPDKLHPYLFDFITFEDYCQILKNDKTILVSPFTWKMILMPIVSFVKEIDFVDLGIGGYSRLDRDKLQESLLKEEKSMISLSDTSEVNCLYLHKIVLYCQEKKLNIVFVNAPTYPTDNVVEGNKVLHTYIEQSFPNIEFKDYELVHLPDSCYGDMTHVNYKGAEIYSELLKEVL